MAFGLAPVFSLSAEDASGALSKLTLTQRVCTTHPSSKFFSMLNQWWSRLVGCSLSGWISLASWQFLHFTNLAYFTWNRDGRIIKYTKLGYWVLSCIQFIIVSYTKVSRINRLTTVLQSPCIACIFAPSLHSYSIAQVSFLTLFILFPNFKL